MSGTRRFERTGPAAKASTFDWPAIERSQEFKELVEERRKFLVPATIVFRSIGFCDASLSGALPMEMAIEPTPEPCARASPEPPRITLS